MKSATFFFKGIPTSFLILYHLQIILCENATPKPHVEIDAYLRWVMDDIILLT
jgi:hypothetical protein